MAARRGSECEVEKMLFNLARTGADAVVLAATELEIIVNSQVDVVPIYDSTVIYAQAGVGWLLGDDVPA